MPSIGVDNFRKASEVSVPGTEPGGYPDQGVYDSNGLLFHGTHPEKNVSVIQTNLTGKISAELAMHLIEILIDLHPDTRVVPIKKKGTKRSVKSQL